MCDMQRFEKHSYSYRWYLLPIYVYIYLCVCVFLISYVRMMHISAIFVYIYLFEETIMRNYLFIKIYLTWQMNYSHTLVPHIIFHYSYSNSWSTVDYRMNRSCNIPILTRIPTFVSAAIMHSGTFLAKVRWLHWYH